MRINKVIHPGAVSVGTVRPAEVFCKISFDGERLSIRGVEGPLPSGNARGSCGQIAMGYAHRDPEQNDARYPTPSRLERFADGWNEDLWLDFLDVWKRWHLNDMRAECEHQRVLGWTYDTHRDTSPDAPPYAGLPCPECGHRIGSSEWKHEDVPAEVVAFLDGLPESTTTPAWV